MPSTLSWFILYAQNVGFVNFFKSQRMLGAEEILESARQWNLGYMVSCGPHETRYPKFHWNRTTLSGKSCIIDEETDRHRTDDKGSCSKVASSRLIEWYSIDEEYVVKTVEYGDWWTKAWVNYTGYQVRHVRLHTHTHTLDYCNTVTHTQQPSLSPCNTSQRVARPTSCRVIWRVWHRLYVFNLHTGCTPGNTWLIIQGVLLVIHGWYLHTAQGVLLVIRGWYLHTGCTPGHAWLIIQGVLLVIRGWYLKDVCSESRKTAYL